MGVGETLSSKSSTFLYPLFSIGLSNHVPQPATSSREFPAGDKQRDLRASDQSSQRLSTQSSDRNIPARESDVEDRKNPGCARLLATACSQQSMFTYSHLLSNNSKRSKKGG